MYVEIRVIPYYDFKECSDTILTLIALGFGCRYSETPHSTSRCRTFRSLHLGTDLDGRILTHNGTYILFTSNVQFVYVSLLCFKACVIPPSE